MLNRRASSMAGPMRCRWGVLATSGLATQTRWVIAGPVPLGSAFAKLTERRPKAKPRPPSVDGDVGVRRVSLSLPGQVHNHLPDPRLVAYSDLHAPPFRGRSEFKITGEIGQLLDLGSQHRWLGDLLHVRGPRAVRLVEEPAG